MQKNTASGGVTHYLLNPTVEQSLTHLAPDRVRLEDIQHEAQAELESLKINVDELHDQARQAQKTAQDKVKVEQAVRDLLDLKQDLLDRAHKLEEQIHSLHRLEALRKRLESYEAELKWIYDSSKAQLRIRESLSGISEDLADGGNTVQRAETRIQEMQSRADAIDLLICEGVLTDVLDPNRDEVDRELNRIRREQAIEEELTKIKAQASV